LKDIKFEIFFYPIAILTIYLYSKITTLNISFLEMLIVFFLIVACLKALEI